MREFKEGEKVLIKGLQSGYIVAEIYQKTLHNYFGEGYLVKSGSTASFYRPKDIHKCPKSLTKERLSKV